jgi:SAM-dependent methyltransferase
VFDASAEFYDAIYASLKDYREETTRIAGLIRGINPQYRTVLDIACGTGEHARHLTQAGFAVDGLDLEPEFVRLAQDKNPQGRFIAGDMRHFELTRRYDVVMCLFSSIGYVRTLEKVAATLRCFRKHLSANGTIIVEPWFAPGILDASRVDRVSCEVNGARITRSSRIELEPGLSRLLFDYEIVDATVTRHMHEIHELGLFTQEELMEAFRTAGLDATYDPIGLMNRGLYVARVRKHG